MVEELLLFLLNGSPAVLRLVSYESLRGLGSPAILWLLEAVVCVLRLGIVLESMLLNLKAILEVLEAVSRLDILLVLHRLESLKLVLVSMLCLY